MSQTKTPVLHPLRNRAYYASTLPVLAAVVAAQDKLGSGLNAKQVAGALASAHLIWFGMVVAISFVESWKKFTAAMVKDNHKDVAFDIGRTVFHALNRAEVFWNLVSLSLWSIKHHLSIEHITQAITKQQSPVAITSFSDIAVVIISVIFALQVLWLQPFLDSRAIAIIRKEKWPSSWQHKVYVLLEVAKVILLLVVPFSFLSELA